MKKFFGILWRIIILVFSIVSFTLAYSQEETEAYRWAFRNWITTQSTIEAANLDWKLTRQELSKMLTNYIENVAWVRQTSLSFCTFPDEDKITDNLKPYTRKICSYKIMWSDWEDFRPTSKVTRAELWTTISRMLWWDKHNVSWKDFYIYHLNALKDQWIMNNIENPTKSLARRWDTFIMLKRLADKYGSNINLNNWSTSQYYSYSFDSSDYDWDYMYEEDDEYISLFGGKDVIYTWEDWTQYYYDIQFLKMLKWLADKKWETDLSNYLRIQIEFSEQSENLEELLDDDEFIEKVSWVSMEDNFQELSQKEKEQAVKRVKTALNTMMEEVEKKCKKYTQDLNDVVKNIKNDKFWLKENYEKTKDYVESTTAISSTLIDTMISLVESEINPDGGASDEELMGAAFGLLWVTFTLQALEATYDSYQQEWATNTIQILNWGSASLKKDNNSSSTSNIVSLSSSSSNEAAQWRARDVARKNDLAQIQTAIITSQQDRGAYPGVNEYNLANGGMTWAKNWMKVNDLSDNLYKAWMSSIPRDPVSSSLVYWLWELYGTKSRAKNNWAMWDYIYIVSKRNGVNDAWFVLMAKTEVEGGSNWVVCKNAEGIDAWYITTDTDLAKINRCQSFKKWNVCLSNSNTCYYTDEEELRYILIY